MISRDITELDYSVDSDILWYFVIVLVLWWQTHLLSSCWISNILMQHDYLWFMYFFSYFCLLWFAVCQHAFVLARPKAPYCTTSTNSDWGTAMCLQVSVGMRPARSDQAFSDCRVISLASRYNRHHIFLKVCETVSHLSWSFAHVFVSSPHSSYFYPYPPFLFIQQV